MGTRSQHGNRSREEDARHYKSGIRVSHRETQDSDVIEVIADFADYLTAPRETVVAVIAE